MLKTISLYFFLHLRLNAFTKESMSLTKTVSLKEGRHELYGVKASLPKYFSFSIKPTLPSNKIYCGISLVCDSAFASKIDAKTFESLEGPLCELNKETSSECSKAGTVSPSGGGSVCLVVYCNNSLGSKDCNFSLSFSIGDALSIAVATGKVPYLYPVVRVTGSGFGPELSDYAAECMNANETAVSCAVKSYIDSKTIELKLSGVWPGSDGPLRLRLGYKGQTTEFVQIGVVALGSLSDYWTYLVVVALLMGLVSYIYYKKLKKPAPQKNGAFPTAYGTEFGEQRKPLERALPNVQENVYY